MNRKSVIIKSNKYGLTVILDDKMPFQELLLDIADKFQESANFFRNAKMAVTFRGRVLNREEERQVIETIVDHCGIHILCVVDEDAVSQEHYRRILNAALEEQEKVDGLFYRGTLSNGEVLETETSVVILGDVHSGAKVVSKSNIVILGSCRGSVYAGATGDRSCFIAAFVMKPVQIRIADKAARSAITKYSDQTEYKPEPKIAYIKENHIHVEPMSQDTWVPFTGQQKKYKNNCEDTKQFTMYTGQTAKTPEQIIFVEKAVGQPQVRLEKIYGGMCNE